MLTANPFAHLEGFTAPEGAMPVALPETPAPASPGLAVRVQRTKKGGFPVFLEKRPNGKTVTVVRNASGDLEGLLKLLKKQCGAGGVVRDDTVEVQGDHRDRVEALLRAGKYVV